MTTQFGGYDVVTFGEAMIRFTPPHFQRLEQAVSLDVTVGGAELNVAVGTARLGLRTAWISKLPRNPLGAYVANKAREQGVDVSHVVWSDEGRAGLYFLEEGAAPRPPSVLYDRVGSAFSLLSAGEIEWADILRGARVLLVSGITPALGEGCAAATGEAMRAAREAGCLVCFDPNYRSRLWDQETAKRMYLQLIPCVDVLLGATAAGLATFFDVGAPDVEAAAREARQRYGLQAVVITTRCGEGALSQRVGSLVVADRVYPDRERLVEIVDRLGAGDAYAAGFLFGLLTGDYDKAAAYGGAAAALKHSIPGDFPLLTEDELRAAVESSSTRIRR